MKFKDALATAWLRNFSARQGLLPPVTHAFVGEKTSKLWPLLLSALLGAGGVTAASGLLGWGATDDTTPVVQEVEQSGSLFQYLEDRGDHLPL